MRVAASPNAVHTRAKELVEHIVLVGSHQQMRNRQTHHAGDMACADIAKIA